MFNTSTIKANSLLLISLCIMGCSSTRTLTVGNIELRKNPAYQGILSEDVEVVIADNVGERNIIGRNQSLSSMEIHLPKGFEINFRQAVLQSLENSGISVKSVASRKMKIILDDCNINYDLKSPMLAIWDANVSIRIFVKNSASEKTNSFVFNGNGTKPNFWGWSDAEQAFTAAYSDALNKINWINISTEPQIEGRNSGNEVSQGMNAIQHPSRGGINSNALKMQMNKLVVELQQLQSQKADAQQSLSLYERTSGTNTGLIMAQNSRIQSLQRLIDQKNNEINALIIQIGNQ